MVTAAQNFYAPSRMGEPVASYGPAHEAGTASDALENKPLQRTPQNAPQEGTGGHPSTAASKQENAHHTTAHNTVD